MAREFTVAEVTEFKIEDWTNAAYPVNFRIKNIHKRWKEHNKAGIPPPTSAAVCLTELVQRTNTTFHVDAITSILQTIDDLRIENEVRGMQLAIEDRVTQARSSDPLTYDNDLKVWKQKVWYLANLYAASIYLEQIAVLKASGKAFNNMDALTSLASRTATWDYVGWYERINAPQATIESNSSQSEEVGAEERDGAFDEEQRAMIDRFAARFNRTAEDEEEHAQAVAMSAQIEAREYVRAQLETDAGSRRVMQEDTGNDASQGLQGDEQLYVQDDIDSWAEEEDLQDMAEVGREGVATRSDEQVDATAPRTATNQTASADASTGTVPSGAQAVSRATRMAAAGSQSTPTREHDRNGRTHYRAPTGGQFVAGSGHKSKANAGNRKTPVKKSPLQGPESTASEQSGRKRRRPREHASSQIQEVEEELGLGAPKRMRTRSTANKDTAQATESQEREASGGDKIQIPSGLPPSAPVQHAETSYQSFASNDSQSSVTASTGGDDLLSAAAGNALTSLENWASSAPSPSRPRLTIKINPFASARKMGD